VSRLKSFYHEMDKYTKASEIKLSLCLSLEGTVRIMNRIFPSSAGELFEIVAQLWKKTGTRLSHFSVIFTIRNCTVSGEM